MGARALELSMGLKPSYVPKTIGHLLNDLSEIDDQQKKLLILFDYLTQCEEELSRVEAFKRELPQCMLLLMDAIETLKKEIMKIKFPKKSESAKTLIEFLPMKRKNCENEQMVLSGDPGTSSGADHRHQLWNSIADRKRKAILHPSQVPTLAPTYKPCRMRNTEVPMMAADGGSSSSSSFFGSSTVEKQRRNEAAIFPGFGAVSLVDLNLRTDPMALNFYPLPLTEEICKNNRRRWSPQLHGRFLDAINFLGGEKEATPKQIRMLMRVQGLTNNQVKSHLQKYRLQLKIGEAQPAPNNHL